MTLREILSGDGDGKGGGNGNGWKWKALTAGLTVVGAIIGGVHYYPEHDGHAEIYSAGQGQNADISELKGELDTALTDLHRLSDQRERWIRGLETDVKDLQQKYSALEAKLEAKITFLEVRISSIESRRR